MPMDFAASFSSSDIVRPGINLSIASIRSTARASCTGFLVTIELSAITIVLSIVIGVVGAWLQGSRLVWTRRIVGGYIHFFRNTPPLVQLYFFYFGLGSLLPVADKVRHHGAAGWRVRLGPASRSASSPARSTWRSFAPASRRCRATTIEAAESLGYSPAARPTPTDRPAARVPHQPAGAQQQPRQPRQDDDARLRRSPCRKCSTCRTRSGRTSSNVPEMMNVLLIAYCRAGRHCSSVAMQSLGARRCAFRGIAPV